MGIVDRLPTSTSTSIVLQPLQLLAQWNMTLVSNFSLHLEEESHRRAAIEG